MWEVGLECEDSMLVKQGDRPRGPTETMCSQSVTVGPTSLQRLFDVREAFKFSPGESQGYISFDLYQEEPYTALNNNTPCTATLPHAACLPDIQRQGLSQWRADSRKGWKLWGEKFKSGLP